MGNGKLKVSVAGPGGRAGEQQCDQICTGPKRGWLHWWHQSQKERDWHVRKPGFNNWSRELGAQM